VNEREITKAETPASAPLHRRRLLTSAAVTAFIAASAAITTPAEARRGGGRGKGKRNVKKNIDRAILNFALQLEYLEAEFYLAATGQPQLTPDLTGGLGIPGPTTGGAAVTFTDPFTGGTASEIAQDEYNHVELLRAVLGADAAAKPAINLNAAGIGFGNQSEFLLLARAFEDTGVTAYGGAAPFVKNGDLLIAAARILAVEAYHAGNIRLQVIQQGLAGSDNALDGIDQPTGSVPPADGPSQFNHGVFNYIPTTPEGLSLIRTFEQVAAIVGPFFPNGLNEVDFLFRR